MKQILKLILLLVIGQTALAQAPSNYVNINGRYRWIAGMFDSTFHIPKGTTPSLRTGGSTNSGGLFYNTSDSSVYTYTGTQWIKLRGSINPSDTTNKYVTQVYKKSGSDSVFYVKGGTHTWAFNDSTGAPGGGGGGKVYYFNGGVSMGTIGGLQMYELGDTANTGAAANFTRSTTGNIANFITDPNKPGLLQIPAGVWSVDAWLSESGGGANHAEIWVEVEKWDGSTITTIATSPIEQITEGGTPNLYSWSVTIPTTSLTITDRIIIQFYISNTNGKTVTLYTQNGYVGEVHTTFTTGIGAINGLTAPAQYLVTGTSGTDFNINSSTATHTFNLPTASATNRGALSTTDWTTFNNKLNASDTASMLSPYLRKVDTTAMLSPYLRSNVAAATYVPQSRTITINGTSQDLSANRTYSVGTVTSVGITAGTGISVANSPVTGSGNITVTNTAPDQTVSLTAGTGISVSGTYPSFTITNSSPSSGGTVTSIATNNGTGITGGTIVSTGTLAIDTLLLSTRAWRQKGIDSVAALANTKISGSGTTNYIPKFTSSSAIGNSVIQENAGSIGINTSPSRTLDVQASSSAIHNTSTTGTNTSYIRTINTGGSLTIGIDNSLGNSLFGTDAYAAGIVYSGAYPLIFGTSATERMRISSTGNVSIGNTNNTYKLDVTGDGRFLLTSTSNPSIRLDYNATSNYGRHLMNSNGDYVFGSPAANGVTSGNLVAQSGASFLVYTNNNATNTTPQLTLNTSGNLGLGVTPSAWYSTVIASQINTQGAIFAQASGNYTGISNNYYVNAAGADKYLQNGYATALLQNNGQFQFYVAGNNTSGAGAALSFTQAMTLDASGNLAIGNTSASGKVHITGGSSGADLLFLNTSGATTKYAFKITGAATDYFTLRRNHPTGGDLDIMSWTYSGNVGIGTTSPAYQLTLLNSGTNVNNGLYLYNTTSNSATGGRYLFNTYSGFGTEALILQEYNSSDVFQRNVMAFQRGTGNVGIGTTSPASTLHIVGTMKFNNTEVAGGYQTLDIIPATTIGSSVNRIATLNTTGLAFETGLSERMRITSGGLVGIGTTSPDVLLTVDGATGGNSSVNLANFYASKGQTDASYLRIQGSRSPTAGSRYIALDVFDGGATSRTLILNQSGGEVYIAGTTDQGAYNLQVNGTGVWGAGAYVNGSDSALKQNIQPLDNSLDIVKQMKPVTYTYKDFYSKDTSVQTGFIAQDLQVLLKDKNYLNGIVKDGTYLSVAYQNLIPLLVKAIQEQQLQIEELKTKIK